MSQQTPIELTYNQRLVLGVLCDAEKPLSAYDIFGKLQMKGGLRSPLQVYRALNKLMTLGIVHRLESLNAFIFCRHFSRKPHKTAAFTICDHCQKVSEVLDNDLAGYVSSVAEAGGVTPVRSVIELHGLCAICRGGQGGDVS